MKGKNKYEKMKENASDLSEKQYNIRLKCGSKNLKKNNKVIGDLYNWRFYLVKNV